MKSSKKNKTSALSRVCKTPPIEGADAGLPASPPGAPKKENDYILLWHAFLFLGLRFFPLFFFLLGGLHCFFL
jgi:hypothetical protein